MAAVQAQLLGGFRLSRADGQALAVPTRKAQALFARLARHPGQPIARESLAGMLWPDVPDEQGRASLRQALAAIRRALPEAPDLLRTREDSVALDQGAVDVDLARVERALSSAEAPLETVLGEGAGPFLATFPPVTDLFDEWAARERAAIGARLRAALGARLEALAGAGSAESALALAERALAFDPAFEAAYRTRMRLLAQRGDRAAALREWERCRDALRREMGIAPGAETEALRQQIAGEAAPADGAARGGDRRPTLAVLPFEVLSTEAADGLFARGLAEDLLVELARFRSLRVVEVAPAAAGRDGRARELAGAADWLLCGSARGAGGRIRLSVRLVDAKTGQQVWTDRFDEDLADVLSVQDRVTRAVASALAVRIDEAELDAARRRRPEALEAYGCWLRGMQLIRAGTREADAEGRTFFKRALELDPAFARAWVGLSLSHFNDWSCVAWDRWDENEREALRCAEEAIRLDGRDHVPHCILGRVLVYRHDWDAAAQHFARALALNANDPDMLAHLAVGYAYLGEPARAVELARSARELNPGHPQWYLACSAVAHVAAHDAPAVVELLSQAPDGFVDSRAALASACGHTGELERGRDHARRFLGRFRSDIVRRAGASPADALEWLFRVNPLRREADRAWLADGLARVGLAASATDDAAARG